MSEHLSRWPDTFIVGAPRCGTTALYQYLKQHPEVYMSPMKEPLFFASDLADHLPGTVIRDQNDYLALFKGTTAERRVGEASPFYLYSDRAPGDIKNRCPDARIIVMLRNPADMMYSMYWAWSYAGIEPLLSFEEALDVDRRGLGASVPFVLRYRQLARLADPTERYLHTFGPSRVHAIVFDDLERDPPAVYRATCRFLDVDPAFQPEFHLNSLQRAEGRRPRSRFLARLVTAPPRGLSALRGRGRLLALARGIVRRWASTRPPALSDELRSRLLRDYRAEIHRLAALIGRDLRAWSAG